MATTEVTTAKLATLLTDYEVALNKGSSAGIRVGDEVVLSNRVDVKDPDSGDSLGNVRVPKLKLSVTVVSEKYSVARVTTRMRSDTLVSALSPLKRMTEDAFDADRSMVHVQVGEVASVTRETPDDEEPPF